MAEVAVCLPAQGWSCGTYNNIFFCGFFLLAFYQHMVLPCYKKHVQNQQPKYLLINGIMEVIETTPLIPTRALQLGQAQHRGQRGVTQPWLGRPWPSGRPLPHPLTRLLSHVCGEESTSLGGDRPRHQKRQQQDPLLWGWPSSHLHFTVRLPSRGPRA